jgi:uncharacterized protein
VFRLTARVIALILAVGLAPVAALGQPAPPPQAELAARRSETPAKHAIWRVAKDGQTVAFLVASIHVLTPQAYPLPPAFDAAYGKTAVLLEEIDLGAPTEPTMAADVATNALLPGGQTLETLLDGPTHARVAAKAAAAGLPMLLLDRMKPWLVAITLMAPDLKAAGFDQAYGLDRHFYDRAKADGRPVQGLETLAYQLDRMNGLSMDVQVEMLQALLDDADTQMKSVRQLVTAWRTGDVTTMERLLLTELREAPEVYQRLLVERNQNWVPTIAGCKAVAPCLVVVGGAHLVGPDSVVALLSKAGFTVEQQ